MLALLPVFVLLGSSDHHAKWMDEDVKYLVSAREKAEFEKLQTELDRSRFIEEFWKRRDPDLATELNEFKEEHYRRIRYANERFFNEGKPGWKTLRGQIYIIHGPPDDVQYFYGGQQKVGVPNPTDILNKTGLALPFIDVEFPVPESELWVYHRILGARYVPSFFGILLAKLEPTDIYHLQRTLHRSPPTAPLEQRAARDLAILEFITRKHYFRSDFRILYAGEPRFRDLQDLLSNMFFSDRGNILDQASVNQAVADLLRPSGDRLEEELERRRRMQELVTSRVYYRRLSLQVGFGFLRDVGGRVRVPFNAEVNFPPTSASPRKLDFLAELASKAGASAAILQDEIQLGKAVSPARAKKISYRARLSVPPGEYIFRIIVSDPDNQQIGYWEEQVQVPRLHGPHFDVGALMLCEKVVLSEKVRKLSRNTSAGGIAFGDKHVLVFDQHAFLPNATKRFRRAQNLTVLLEVYNPTLIQDQPAVEIQASCRKDGKALLVTPARQLDYLTGTTRNIIIYAFTIPLRSLDPGKYDFYVTVTDQPTGRQVEKSASFEIW